MQSVEAPVAQAAASVTGWAHSSLAVSELDEAARFFCDALGFEVVFREDDMADQIASMTGLPSLSCRLAQLRHPVSSHVLELIAFTVPADAPAADPRPIRPGSSHVAFRVADLAAAIALVERHGATLLGPVTGFDDGPAVYARVPGGAFIELEGPAA